VDEHGRLAFGTPTRIGLWATLASAGIGLFLALFQVQGWTMPQPLAVLLIALLLGVIAVAVSMIVIEIYRVVSQFLEHRATSTSWVASDSPGLLDYEADGIRAMDRFTDELNKMNRDTESLGKSLDKHTKRIVRLRGKSAKRRQRGANRSANSINKSAVYIEKRLALLKALVKDIERNYRGLFGAVDIASDDDMVGALALRDILDTGRATTAETLAAVRGYRVSVEETEALNLSRTVRIASGRLAKGLRGIETIFTTYEKAAAGIVRDFDRKIEQSRGRSSRSNRRAA
jgi:hypothetical protein